MTDENPGEEPIQNDPTSFAEMLARADVRIFAVPVDSGEDLAQLIASLSGMGSMTVGESIAHIAGEMYGAAGQLVGDIVSAMGYLDHLAKHVAADHPDDTRYDAFRAMFPDQDIFLKLQIAAIDLDAHFLDGIRDPEPEMDAKREVAAKNVAQVWMERKQELKRRECRHLYVEHAAGLPSQVPLGTPGLCRHCSQRVERGAEGWLVVPAPEAI